MLLIIVLGAAGLLAGPVGALVTVHGSEAFKKQVAACFDKFRTNDPENIVGTLEKSKVGRYWNARKYPDALHAKLG